MEIVESKTSQIVKGASNGDFKREVKLSLFAVRM